MATWEEVHARMQGGAKDADVLQNGMTPREWRAAYRLKNPRNPGGAPLQPTLPTGGGHAPGGPAGPDLNEPFGGGMMKPGQGMGGMGGMGGSSPQMLASALRNMGGGTVQRPGMDPNATGGMGGASMGGMGQSGSSPQGGSPNWAGTEMGSGMPGGGRLGGMGQSGASPDGGSPDWMGTEMGASTGGMMGGAYPVTGGMNPAMGGQMPGRTLRAPQFSGMNQSMYPQPQGGRANYGNAQPFFGFSQR